MFRFGRFEFPSPDVVVMLIHREIPPSPSLARFIDRFWSLEGSVKAPSASPQKIPPDGCMEIVFNLADPFKRHRPNRPPEIQPKIIVVGQMRSFASVEPTGRVSLFGIRFHTAGACAVFDFPLTELTDEIPSLGEFWRSRADELAERIHECASVAERVAVAEAVLSRRFIRPDNLDAMVEAGVRRIRLAGGSLTTGSLLDGMNVGERQFERRFREKIGLAPKRFSRIVRFQKVLAARARGVPESWSSLAHDCGYYDQAHLIRDFREFSGESPAAYLGRTHDFSDRFTRRDAMSDFSNTAD